ncbi:MAG: hypothetical protein RIC52_08175 [Amphiplicatus sp.]
MTSKKIRLGNVVSRVLLGFSSDRSGLTAVHYGLIAALVALVALPGIQLIGNNTSGELMSMADKVASNSEEGMGGGESSDDGASDDASGEASSGDNPSGDDSSDSSDSGADDGDAAGNDDGGKKKKKKKKKK